MIDFLNWLINALAVVVTGLLSILPDSPFQFDFGFLSGYMGFINYVIPVGTLVSILGTYLVAVGIWYGIRWILRFAKYID